MKRVAVINTATRKQNSTTFIKPATSRLYTEEALLTDTLVRGQLQSRPPSQNPVFLNSHTNSVFLHSRKRAAPGTGTFFASRGCLLTRASTAEAIQDSPKQLHRKFLTTNLDKRGLLTGEEVFRENKRHLQESHGSPNKTFSLLKNDKMYNHKSIS